MLPKTPKRAPILKRLVGGLVAFEVLCFGGAYFVWHKLNTSREYREKAKQSAPWALDIYYKMGELLNKQNKAIRDADDKVWQSTPVNKTD